MQYLHDAYLSVIQLMCQPAADSVKQTATRGFYFYLERGQIGTDCLLCCWPGQLCSASSANSAVSL